MKKVAAELYKEKFENTNEIKGIESDLENKFAQLASSGERKKTTLTAELNNQKTINDNLCKEFAEAIKQFTDWLAKVCIIILEMLTNTRKKLICQQIRI